MHFSMEISSSTAGGGPARSYSAQSVKEHRERRERDLAIAAVAGDEQRMRAAYAERIGAGERRRSRAAKVWTALHTRAAYAGRRPVWSSPAAVQPDGGIGTRSDLFGCRQHGQGCCWHVERTAEERVRKSGLVLPFTKREVPREPFRTRKN